MSYGNCKIVSKHNLRNMAVVYMNGLLNENHSARHGKPPYELLVMETAQDIAIALGYPLKLLDNTLLLKPPILYLKDIEKSRSD